MTPRETAVVVGASLGGLSAVRALREQGYDGRLVLIGEEPHLPYDRPPLSKGFLLGTVSREKLVLADDAELDTLAVERRFGEVATGLRAADRAVLVGDEEIVADHVVLATGSRPRALRGAAPLPGVHLLRTIEDALALRDVLVPGVRLVIVGAGFIGSEVAGAARTLGADVTVVEMLDVPLSLALGEDMGAVCAALHAANGVTLRTGVGVTALLGHDRVTGVELSDGSVLDADLVLVSVGAAPVTEWLEGSGLELDNGVVTDAHGLTSVPHVAAVGDVARPAGPWTAAPHRVEHWTNALENPARTITALLGGDVDALAHPRAPYFWSDQYGVMIQFAGHREPGDPVRIVEGDPDSGSFVAVYDHGDQVSAVIAMNAGRSFNKLRRQLLPRHGEVPA
ncbi:MAG TPA: FAD-dependent oxidoreductase [Mycobacteriales bacterium]|jgi:3-phenylpropionate/trans-cinnamate dioxygenase ferredoxin reductase subunit|nr:FAD-dependent oxidoreductase [Mycobacteriales bacterium]